MIELALGILIGLLLAGLALAAGAYSRPTIDRTLKQTASKSMQKGAVIEPQNEELQQWINTLKHEEV
jgi:hypothetical protein